MGKCSVQNCKFKSQEPSQTIDGEIKVGTFKFPGERVPDDRKLRAKWVNNLREFGGNSPDWKPSPHCRVCSLHFKPDCMTYHTKRIALARYAVPTLFGDQTKKIVFKTKIGQSKPVVPKQEICLTRSAKISLIAPRPGPSGLHIPTIGPGTSGVSHTFPRGSAQPTSIPSGPFSFIQCPTCQSKMPFPSNMSGVVDCVFCRSPMKISLRQEVSPAPIQPIVYLQVVPNLVTSQPTQQATSHSIITSGAHTLSCENLATPELIATTVSNNWNNSQIQAPLLLQNTEDSDTLACKPTQGVSEHSVVNLSDSTTTNPCVRITDATEIEVSTTEKHKSQETSAFSKPKKLQSGDLSSKISNSENSMCVVKNHQSSEVKSSQSGEDNLCLLRDTALSQVKLIELSANNDSNHAKDIPIAEPSKVLETENMMSSDLSQANLKSCETSANITNVAGTTPQKRKLEEAGQLPPLKKNNIVRKKIVPPKKKSWIRRWEEEYIPDCKKIARSGSVEQAVTKNDSADELLCTICLLDVRTAIPVSMLQEITGISNVCQVLGEIDPHISDKISKSVPLCSCSGNDNSCDICDRVKDMKLDNCENVLNNILQFFLNFCEKSYYGGNISKELIPHAKAVWTYTLKFMDIVQKDAKFVDLVQKYATILFSILKSVCVPLEESIKFFQSQFDCLDRSFKKSDVLYENIQVQYASSLISYSKFDSLIFWCDSVLANFTPDYYLLKFVEVCMELCAGYLEIKSKAILDKCSALLKNNHRPDTYDVNRLVVVHYYMERGLDEEGCYLDSKEECNFDDFKKRVNEQLSPGDPLHLVCSTVNLIIEGRFELCIELEDSLCKSLLVLDRQVLYWVTKIIKCIRGISLENGRFYLKILKISKYFDFDVLHPISSATWYSFLPSSYNYRRQLLIKDHLLQVCNLLQDRDDLTQVLFLTFKSLDCESDKKVTFMNVCCDTYFNVAEDLKSCLANVCANFVTSYQCDDSKMYSIFVDFCQGGKKVTSSILAAMGICINSLEPEFSHLNFWCEQLQGRDDIPAILSILKNSDNCSWEQFLSLCLFVHPRVKNNFVKSFIETECKHIINENKSETHKSILHLIMDCLQQMRDVDVLAVYASLGFTFLSDGYREKDEWSEKLSKVLEERCEERSRLLNHLEIYKPTLQQTNFLLKFYLHLYHMSSNPLKGDYARKCASLLLTKGIECDMSNVVEFSIFLIDYILSCVEIDKKLVGVVRKVIKIFCTDCPSVKQARLLCKLLQGEENEQIVHEMSNTISLDHVMSKFTYLKLCDIFVSTYWKLPINVRNIATQNFIVLIQSINLLSLKDYYIVTQLWRIVVIHFQENDDCFAAFVKVSLAYLELGSHESVLTFLCELTKDDIKKYFVKVHDMLSTDQHCSSEKTLYPFVKMYQKICDLPEKEYICLRIATVCIAIINKRKCVDVYFICNGATYEYPVLWELAHKLWTLQFISNVNHTSVLSAMEIIVLSYYWYNDKKHNLILLWNKILCTLECAQVINSKFMSRPDWNIADVFPKVYLMLDEPARGILISYWIDNEELVYVLSKRETKAGEMLLYYCEKFPDKINDDLLSRLVGVSVFQESNKNNEILKKWFKLCRSPERARHILQTTVQQLDLSIDLLQDRLYMVLNKVKTEVATQIIVGAFVSLISFNTNYSHTLDYKDFKIFFKMLTVLDNYESLDSYVIDKAKLEINILKQCKHFLEERQSTKCSEELDRDKILDVLVSLFGKNDDISLLKFLINLHNNCQGIFENVVAKRCVSLMMTGVKIDNNEDLLIVQKMCQDFVTQNLCKILPPCLFE